MPEATSEKQWNPEMYDTKHSYVWKYGEDVIELLATGHGLRITGESGWRPGGLARRQ